MASICPYSLGYDMATGAVDFDTHSFKIMLLTPSYTPSQAHDRRNDVEANEVSASGTGYVAGGEDITVSSVTRSNGVTSVTFASRTTWTNPLTGLTARYGAIYRAVGGASSADPLVGIVDFGGNVVANGLDFAVDITSALTITVS